MRPWTIGHVVGSLAGGVLLALAPVVAVGRAGADPGPAFHLQAQGDGLKVTIAGTTLVGGSSSASAGSGAGAAAMGAGSLTPAIAAMVNASAGSAGASQQFPQTCAQPAVPFPAPLGALVQLGVGCASASASEDGAAEPQASGSGQVASVTLLPSVAALPTTVLAATPLAAALTQVLGSLPPLPAGGSSLSTVLGSVASAANAQLGYLVNVTAGSSTSTVAATASSATASTQDAGVTISLLDGLGASGGPLATVTVGAAATTTTLDRTTGVVTATDTPALVTVSVDPPVGSSQHFSLAPGVSQTILAGTPLQSTIAAGSGSTSPGNGQGGATANGVLVDAVQGIGATDAAGSNGGVDVEVGSATSGSTGSAPAAVPPVPTPTPTAPAPTHLVAAPPPAAAAPVPAVPVSSTTPGVSNVPGVTTVHTGEFWAGTLPVVLAVVAGLTGMALIGHRRLRSVLHRLVASGPAPPTPGPRSPGSLTTTAAESGRARPGQR